MQGAIASCRAWSTGYRLVAPYHPTGRNWGWGGSLACTGPTGEYDQASTTKGQTTWRCFSPAEQQSMVIAGSVIWVFVAAP